MSTENGKLDSRVKHLIFATAAMFYYMAVGFMFVYALSHGNNTWPVIAVISRIVLGLTVIFCIVTGAIGGLTMKRIFTVPLINAIGFAILTLLIAAASIFTEASTAGLVLMLLGGIFGLTVASGYAAWVLRRLKREKIGLRAFIACDPERAAIYRIAVSAAVFYAAVAVPYYIFERNFDVTSLIIAILMPAASIAVGIWSGRTLKRISTGSIITAASIFALVFYRAVTAPAETHSLYLLPPFMAIFTLIADMITRFVSGMKNAAKRTNNADRGKLKTRK